MLRLSDVSKNVNLHVGSVRLSRPKPGGMFMRIYKTFRLVGGAALSLLSRLDLSVVVMLLAGW